MKRIFKIVFVLMTIFVLQLTALAADSPHVIDKVTATDANGNPVNVVISAPPAEMEALARKNVPESAKVTPGANFLSRQAVTDFEFAVDENTAYPLEVSMSIEGLVPNSTVKVLIYTNAEMTEYIIVDAIVGDGWVKVLLKEGDPVSGIMVVNYTVPVKSPKTQADYTSCMVLLFTSFVLLSAVTVNKVKYANQKSK